MEFSSLFDTSLDLNAKPLRAAEEAPPPPRPPPPPPKQEGESRFIDFGRNATVHQERGALVEELKRMTAENKKLTEMLSAIFENYLELRKQLVDYTNKNPTNTSSRKRSVDGTSTVGPSPSSSNKEDPRKKTREDPVKANVSEVRVRIEASDASHIVKDGYQWRKYGQKVQRSVEDQSILMATYKGEHNHTHSHPSKVEAKARPNRSSTLGNAPSSSSRMSLDFTKPIVSSSRGKGDEAPRDLEKILEEEMASTLTRDPSFKAALAAALSGNILQHTQKW